MGNHIVKANLNGTYIEGELIADDESKSFVVVYISDPKFLGVTGDIEVPRAQILEIV